MIKFLVLCLIFLFLPFQAATRKQILIGEINHELKNLSALKIVVFKPTISEETEYASMVIQAFRNYFVKKLAFDLKDRENISIEVILITDKEGKGQIIEQKEDQGQGTVFFGKSKQEIKSSFFNKEGIQIYPTRSSSLKENLELPSLLEAQSDSVLFLLDFDNTIVLRDDQYRGQGEHLKPLEYKIKELLGISYPKILPEETSINIGDKAPNILLEGRELSDYQGMALMLTFYPEAYSGIFDTSLITKRISEHHLSMMSCVMHITSFDSLSSKIGGLGVGYFAVSESTPEILANWKEVLETYHIQYINNPDYSLSKSFGSYNSNGYNKRVCVIIDKKGYDILPISIMINDYKLGKKKEIQEIVEKLMINI